MSCSAATIFNALNTFTLGAWKKHELACPDIAWYYGRFPCLTSCSTLILDFAKATDIYYY